MHQVELASGNLRVEAKSSVFIYMYDLALVFGRVDVSIYLKFADVVRLPFLDFGFRFWLGRRLGRGYRLRRPGCLR